MTYTKEELDQEIGRMRGMVLERGAVATRLMLADEILKLRATVKQQKEEIDRLKSIQSGEYRERDAEER